jgi:hypothetical protein
LFFLVIRSLANKMAKSIALWRIKWRSLSLFGEMESPFGEMGSRFGEMESRFGEMESRFGEENGEVNRALAKKMAKKWRRKWRTQSLFIGVLKGIPLYDNVGSSLQFFYSYLHKILIYSFSHIDLSFLAHPLSVL